MFFMENACCHPEKLSKVNAAIHWYSRVRGSNRITAIKQTNTRETSVPLTRATRRSG